MPKLTPEQRAINSRERMIEVAKQYQLGTYINRFVAPVFQSCVRAEAGAMPDGLTTAIVRGELGQSFRRIGQCVCITCGMIGPWKGNFLGGGVIETGHFVASRRASIVFEETNAHPQCKNCNRHLSGNQGVYELWMRTMFGQDEIDRLRRLKNASITFDREQLVDKRIAYQARLDAAIRSMETG